MIKKCPICSSYTIKVPLQNWYQTSYMRQCYLHTNLDYQKIKSTINGNVYVICNIEVSLNVNVNVNVTVNVSKFEID